MLNTIQPHRWAAVLALLVLIFPGCSSDSLGKKPLTQAQLSGAFPEVGEFAAAEGASEVNAWPQADLDEWSARRVADSDIDETQCGGLEEMPFSAVPNDAAQKSYYGTWAGTLVVNLFSFDSEDRVDEMLDTFGEILKICGEYSGGKSAYMTSYELILAPSEHIYGVPHSLWSSKGSTLIWVEKGDELTPEQRSEIVSVLREGL